MKCPSCGVPFAAPVPECPNCQLTLAQLDRKFGMIPYYSRYLSDRSERLHMHDIEELRKLLRLWERKFPQVFFSVFLMDLGSHISISEYTFWVANRARFSAVSSIGPKNFDLLLLVDPKGQAAGLSTGYALEQYLTEQDLQAALDVAGNGFNAGDLVRGIRECIEFMTVRLREIVLRIEESKRTENKGPLPATATNAHELS